MPEKYPTCCKCGSTELTVDDRISGTRSWIYSSGKERVIDAEDIDESELLSAMCLSCGHEMEADELTWKEFATP